MSQSERRVYADLQNYCRHRKIDAEQAKKYTNAITNLSPELRTNVVRRTNNGRTLLFHASINGHLDVIDYLIDVCGAEIDQRSACRFSHYVAYVTPLMAAIRSRRIDVVRRLLSHGADVDARFVIEPLSRYEDCHKCFIHECESVNCWADSYYRSAYTQATCFMQSVDENFIEACEIFLANGADPNAKDINDDTALHYAVGNNKKNMVKFLLNNNVDPHAINNENYDALRLASIVSKDMIFALAARVAYPQSRFAEIWMLYGCSAEILWFDENPDNKSLRLSPLKTCTDENDRTYDEFDVNVTIDSPMTIDDDIEFTCDEDTENNAATRLEIRSYAIHKRILGSESDRLLYDACYQDQNSSIMLFRYRFNFWRYALKTHLDKHSLLCANYQQIVCCIIYQTYMLYEELRCGDDFSMGMDFVLRYHDVKAFFQLVAEKIVEASQQLENSDKKHVDQDLKFDKLLKWMVRLIHVLVISATTNNEITEAKNLIIEFAKHDLKSSTTRDSLLHAFFLNNRQRQNNDARIVDNAEIFDDDDYEWPSLRGLDEKRELEIELDEFIELQDYETSLIKDNEQRSNCYLTSFVKALEFVAESGIPVNARNNDGYTPLHIAVEHNYCKTICKVLVNRGAHVYRTNDDTIDKLKATVHGNNVRLFEETNLHMLAAIAVNRHNIDCSEMFWSVNDFVKEHEFVIGVK